MNEPSDALQAAQRARLRALIIPREHGAWGLLLVPLFTGVVAGYPSHHRIWPLLIFAIGALSLFWLRTPVESLIGTSPITASTKSERRSALLASACLSVLGIGCMAGLMWRGQNLQLLLLGGAAGLAFLVQSVLKWLGRKTRMAAQLAGAIGLVCTAPAAYYIGTGYFDERAFILWVANWIFACDQIHFVQLRIHSARAKTFSEKIARGKYFLVGQFGLIASLVTAGYLNLLPRFVVVAFIPALVRGTWWFVRKPEPLDVKSLGWSEMKLGVAFGLLLAVAVTYC